jgi:hypothetical protein
LVFILTGGAIVTGGVPRRSNSIARAAQEIKECDLLPHVLSEMPSPEAIAQNPTALAILDWP